jgi:hypothetical protein
MLWSILLRIMLLLRRPCSGWSWLRCVSVNRRRDCHTSNILIIIFKIICTLVLHFLMNSHLNLSVREFKLCHWCHHYCWSHPHLIHRVKWMLLLTKYLSSPSIHPWFWSDSSVCGAVLWQKLKLKYCHAYFESCRSQVSSVSIVSDYGLDKGSIPGRDKGCFLYPLCPYQLWGPPSLLSSGYRGSYFRG